MARQAPRVVLRRRRPLGRRLLAVVPALTAPSFAAELPPHGPLRVLVVSDEVNPHGLGDAELTQPQDIAAALNAPDSGLELVAGGAVEVSSQCIDDALAALRATDRPDVLVYFAHRGARDCAGGDQQAPFTAEVENLLRAGGGVVVFHHGTYQDAAKGEILALLGVSAGSIQWDTAAGQRVFNLAPGHFVTTNGVRYDGIGELSGTAAIPSGSYEYFDNVPDERYPATNLLTEAGENRTLLFASNSGPVRVLGYALERAGFEGRVVVYQPGEYQPNALDDRSGPNFQVFANAIVYAARRDGGDSGGSGAGGDGGGGEGANASTGGAAGSAGMASRAGAGAGVASAAGSGGTGGGGGAAGSAGTGVAGAPPAGASGSDAASAARGGSGPAGGSPGTGATSNGGGPSAGSRAGGSASAEPAPDDGGCGCRTARGAGGAGTWLGSSVLAAVWLLQRRKARQKLSRVR